MPPGLPRQRHPLITVTSPSLAARRAHAGWPARRDAPVTGDFLWSAGGGEAVRRQADGGGYPRPGGLAGEYGWGDALTERERADVLRSTLRDEYAQASDAELAEALENMLDAMSPAEGFNFSSALSQIGRGAGQ